MINQVLDAIFGRRSVRGYSQEALTQEEIKALVEAALISPSAMNREPWHLSVMLNQEQILELEREIIAYYQEHGPAEVAENNAKRNNKIFYDAPAVFVISMQPERGLDAGIMVQSIAIAAQSMGLNSVILGLPRVAFIEDDWKQRLQFPEDYVFGIAIAVGHGILPPKPRAADHSKVTFFT